MVAQHGTERKQNHLYLYAIIHGFSQPRVYGLLFLIGSCLDHAGIKGTTIQKCI